MRLFFAKETGREKTLELLYAYREQCLADMKEVGKAHDLLNQTKFSYTPEEVLYWKLSVMHGDMMRKTRLEWVDKAIEILKQHNK